MDSKIIQSRMDAMPAPMAAKGLKNPVAEFKIEGNVGFRGTFMWSDGTGAYRLQFSHHRGDTPEDVLTSMEAWIVALPTVEESNLRSFMSALGNVIDLGRERGIEVAFVNPLVETMKRLSENALTHQKVAAE